MNVIHWIHGLQGGAGFIACSICEKFSAPLIYFDEDGPANWGTSKRSASLTGNLKNLIKLENWEDFKNYVNNWKPDIIVYHIWREEDNSPKIASQECKQVAYVHTSMLPNLNGYDFYILVSKSQFSTIPINQSSNIRVIENGVRVEQFADCIPSNTQLNLLRFSSLDKQKISPWYKEIFEEYQSSDISFTFIGGGNGVETLKSYARQTGNPNVYLLGDSTFEEIIEQINQASAILYLNDTHIENHSISILEAMVAGLPIICENRGGLAEQVDHTKNGFLCNNVEDVFNAIEAIKEQGGWNILSSNSRKKGESYKIEKTFDQFFQFMIDIKNLN